MSVSRIRHLLSLRRCIQHKTEHQAFIQTRHFAGRDVDTTGSSQSGAKTSTNETGDESYPFMSTMKTQNANSTEFFVNTKPDTSWQYQKYIVHACLSIFLIYFLVLRKENHIDKNIALLLYEAAPDIERYDLKKKIDEYKKDGKNTEEMEKRLDILLRNKV